MFVSFRDELCDLHNEAGRVRVGAGPLAFSYLMPNLLTESVRSRPLVSVTASMQGTADLIAALIDGELDFCICAANSFSSPPMLAVEAIGHLRLGLFVRSGHPLAGLPEPLSWNDFRPFPRAGGRMIRLEENDEATAVRSFEQTVDCDDFELLRRIMLQSDAIWLTGANLLTQELKAATVTEIGKEYSANMPFAEMVVVTVRARSRSPAAAEMIRTAIALMHC